MTSVTDFAVLRTPFDYGPYETNPYADQLEREFNRVGLGHLYETIVDNAAPEDVPGYAEAQDKIEELEREVVDLRGRVEYSEGREADLDRAVSRVRWILDGADGASAISALGALQEIRKVVDSI